MICAETEDEGEDWSGLLLTARVRQKARKEKKEEWCEWETRALEEEREKRRRSDW